MIMGKKAKPNQWDYTILKSFCTAKETINKMKRQLIACKEILVKYISDKGLISRICKGFMQLNSKEKKSNSLNRYFSKEEMDSQQYVNRCSTSLIIREIQMKTTVRYHLTPVRMAIIKKYKKYKCW